MLLRVNATNVGMHVHYTNTFLKLVNLKLYLNYINPTPILGHFIVPNERKKDENKEKGKLRTVGQ